MTTSFDTVAILSEQELLGHFASLVVRDRRTTAELLVAIAEIDERKLWAAHACSSMFTFCMERFHMSEQVTAKRLWAARTARRFPVVLEMVARGELHLGAIHLLAKHLTEDNHERVLERARHKSSREVERLVAELAPQADVASRVRALPWRRGNSAAVGGGSSAVESPEVAAKEESSMNSVPAGSAGDDRGPGVVDRDRRFPEPAPARTAAKPIVSLSPRRYKIEITVDEATHDKLRSLQDLLGRSATGRDPAEIIARAIDVLLERTLARRAGSTDRPRPMKRATSADAHRTGRTAAMTRDADAATSTRKQPSRTIPAAVRREVWQRDCGRCCYVDARGRRCGATSNVEFHHRNPFAMGGPPTPQNIELRCAAHNQHQADLDFGRSFMDAKRGKVGAARHSPGNVAERRLHSPGNLGHSSGLLFGDC
jgi:5-methylcytosine-specific restriction endonuclease McrA